MEQLDVLIGGVQEVEAEAQASVQEKTAETRATLEAAQANIIAGTETTGSPLHDGIIAIYGAGLARSPEIVRSYEKIAADLKGHAGEPVVLIRRSITQEGCTGFGGRGRTQSHLNEIICVGVLDGDELLFSHKDTDRPGCDLPTSRYISEERFSRSFQDREPKQIDGGLPLRTKGQGWERTFYDVVGRGSIDKTIGVDDLPISRQIGLRKGLPATVLAIGNDGIKDWLSDLPFGENGTFGNVRRLCDELGIDRIPPANDDQKFYLKQ